MKEGMGEKTKKVSQNCLFAPSRRRVFVFSPRNTAVCLSQIPVQPGRLETRILLDLVGDPGFYPGNENPNFEMASM